MEWWNKGEHYRFHGKLKQGEEHLNKFKHSCSREQRIKNLSKVNDNPNFWKEKFVENPELLESLSNRMTNKNLNPEYQEKCNEGFRKFLSNPENKHERQRKILLTKSIRFIESLGFPNREITEDEYNEKRKSNTRVIPTWDTATKCGLKEYMSNYNHKIQEPVKIVKLEKSIPVYDLTVDKYHNFLISTDNNHEYVKEGIFVHNCGVGDSADPSKSRYERIIIATDADPDGCHIVALILTALVNLVPPIVKAGMVYLLDPPLYKYEIGNEVKYTSNFEEVPSNAKHFIRFKGLGAMEDEDFKNTCLNKENRTLYQVSYPDDIDYFNTISGTSWGRSELLKSYGIIHDVTSDFEISECDSDE